MMLPTIKDKLPEEPGERGEDEPDLKFFNDIRVEDPRVAELCNRASEPGPFHILVTCLQRSVIKTNIFEHISNISIIKIHNILITKHIKHINYQDTQHINN